METGAQRRPGGRTARTRLQVLEATRQLLESRTEEQISVPDIAEKSGVHPATIYRRWGSVAGVLLDCAAANLEEESPVPNTGTLQGDLREYARLAAQSITAPGGLGFLRAVLHQPAAEFPDLDEAGRLVLQHRANGIQEMLNRASVRGEPELHFTDVIDGILSPLYFRTLFEIGGIDPSFLNVLVQRTILTPTLRTALSPRQEKETS